MKELKETQVAEMDVCGTSRQMSASVAARRPWRLRPAKLFAALVAAAAVTSGSATAENEAVDGEEKPFVLTKDMLAGGLKSKDAKPVIHSVDSLPSALVGSSAAADQGSSLKSLTGSAMQQVQSALDAAARALDAAGALEQAGAMTSAEAGVLKPNGLDGGVFPSPPPASPPTEKAQAPAPAPLDVGTPVVAPGMCIEDCSGHGSCLDKTCQCEGGWTGEACDIEPCLNDCNGRGTCLQGGCVCNAAFYGLTCEFSRCLNDCSGHGYCNEGQCECTKPFRGTSCDEEMAVQEAVTKPVKFETEEPPSGLRMALAGFMGQMPIPCIEDCNGNGKCSAKGVCECSPGYSGNACQDYCPNLCSGQGQCTTGRCLCLAGFGGPDCSVKMCCSGHGDCSMPGQCICNPGWLGEQCEVMSQCPDPSCSGHGTCKDGNCECTAGFSGVTCMSQPTECGKCPPGGICDRDVGMCLCNGAPCPGMQLGGAGGAGGSGYGASGGSAGGGAGGFAAGAGAGGFGAGGPGGKFDPSSMYGSHRRRVAADGAAPQGATPGSTKVVYQKGNLTNVDLTPKCNAPYGEWDAEISACECKDPWYGEDCEKSHCYGYNETLGIPDCSAHGMCVAGECQCAAGWGLALSVADQMSGGKGPNVCSDQVCPVDCGQHGMCQDNTCICQDGWQGPACREPKCPLDCSGHGTCTFTLANSPGECVCDYGFSAPDCASVALYSKLRTCPNDCSGNGLCMDGKCVCSAGSFGEDCAGVNCPEGSSGPSCQFHSCPRDCSGYGACFDGQCACDADHKGSDCSVPVICWDACSAICLPDLGSERCESCKGNCLTLGMNPVMGQHNPLTERLYTLVQKKQAVTLGVVPANSDAPSSPVRLGRRKKTHHKEVSSVLLSGSDKLV